MFADRATRAAANQAENIQLETRLDERKISRPEPYRDFAPEDTAEQRLHEVNQIGDRYFAIHHHAFHLIKRVLVRSVYFFVPKNSPRGDHAQWRLKRAHAAHVHGRRMGPQ